MSSLKSSLDKLDKRTDYSQSVHNYDINFEQVRTHDLTSRIPNQKQTLQPIVVRQPIAGVKAKILDKNARYNSLD